MGLKGTSSLSVNQLIAVWAEPNQDVTSESKVHEVEYVGRTMVEDVDKSCLFQVKIADIYTAKTGSDTSLMSEYNLVKTRYR